MKTVRLILSIVSALIIAIGGAAPVFAAEPAPLAGIPVKALLLIDQGFAATGASSGLYENTRETLDINRIPFDVLDITQMDRSVFFDGSAKLRYSVTVLLAPAWRIEDKNSQLILDAAKQGMGVVGTISDAVNEKLKPLFGIEAIGREWKTSQGIAVLEDKFTLAYAGATIEGEFSHLTHRLARDVEVVGNFTRPAEPAVWCYRYGPAKTVFHNNSSAVVTGYRGLLLESILYAMPLGVGCPINAGVIEVDDCPLPFYTNELVGEAYYNYYANFKRWLETYNLRASFFLAFSYNGNARDFYLYPESVECANDIIKSGNEIGLHCGSNHIPLQVNDWGSKGAVDSEVRLMNAAMEDLRAQLKQRYGTDLGEITSYIPPANEIDDYGYRALAQSTDIKYVGGSYFGNEEVSARDFGQEKDLGIYNLPRSAGGGFNIFNEPQDRDYANVWNTLRSVVESGDSYLIFTHPYGWEYQDKERFGDGSMQELFETYRIWADYVAKHYPFYRWMTSSQLGNFLENRKGVMDAAWNADKNRLVVRNVPSGEVIHVKARDYLQSVEKDGDSVVLTFGNMQTRAYSDLYDIVQIGQDYFLNPKSVKATYAASPGLPFVFTEMTAARPSPSPRPPAAVADNLVTASARSPVTAALGIGTAVIFILVAIVILSRKGPNVLG